jgi:hypothetical protein
MTYSVSIDKPDFARYSAEQLRQILTRLDAERYPERAQEIAERLAALEMRSSAGALTASLPLGARTKISSDISVGVHKVGGLIVAVGCLLCFISTVFSTPLQNTGWSMLLLFVVLAMVGQLAGNQYMEEVFLVDDALIMVRQGREACVALTGIDSVEVIDHDGVVVELRLSSESDFGRRIVFVPATGFFYNPFKEIPVVDALRARIAAAKAR